jgi:hypothetical protein
MQPGVKMSNGTPCVLLKMWRLPLSAVTIFAE